MSNDTYCPIMGKLNYESRAEAQSARLKILGRGVPGNLNIYECPCGKFHLSSHVRIGNKAKALRRR